MSLFSDSKNGLIQPYSSVRFFWKLYKKKHVLLLISDVFRAFTFMK